MDTRDLTTQEMLQALTKSKNEIIARKCQRILNQETTIEAELKWSGSFLTYVLTGDFKNAMRNADSYNRKALENALTKEVTLIKLFTEEQVIQMIEKSRETGLTAEYLILTTPSIELPTDEQIDDEASHYIEIGSSNSFRSGAEWMRDKIKGGKDE